MANSTITGNSSNNGATLTNATDGGGVPSQNPSDVTVQTANATVSGTGAFYDVNFLAGNDTLIASNMPWVHPDTGDTVGFDNIDMGTGDDYVELTRTGFYDTTNMGDGADTLFLNNSGGQNVLMGTGNDLTRVDMSQASSASEEELAQKSGVSPLHIDGEGGTDTLNLVGAWTLTLSSGNVTLDTDGNGTGDSVTNVLTSAQYSQVVGLPSLLSGTVRWGDTITLSGGDTVVAKATFANFEDLNAVCFAQGTRIATPDGEVAVEDLCEGDPVLTPLGPQPIRWIGKRRLDVIDLMANPKLLPVVIGAGAFGAGLPMRDLRVSPQHRLLLRSKIAARMFGADHVLVQAKQLVGLDGIAVDGSAREVIYFHFMLDQHAIVTAEGIGAETLYPGPQALGFLTDDARAELLAIFPELLAADADPPPACPMIKGRDARALIARHARNARPLWS